MHFKSYFGRTIHSCSARTGWSLTQTKGSSSLPSLFPHFNSFHFSSFVALFSPPCSSFPNNFPVVRLLRFNLDFQWEKKQRRFFIVVGFTISARRKNRKKRWKSSEWEFSLYRRPLQVLESFISSPSKECFHRTRFMESRSDHWEVEEDSVETHTQTKISRSDLGFLTSEWKPSYV